MGETNRISPLNSSLLFNSASIKICTKNESLTPSIHPLKKRVGKIAVVCNAKEHQNSLRVRLFWPLLALLLISPVIAWKIAEKKIENSSGLERAKIPGKPGPWGDLEYVPISIEIPDHFVNVEEIDETDW